MYMYSFYLRNSLEASLQTQMNPLTDVFLGYKIISYFYEVYGLYMEVRKKVNIRNNNNQVPHLTQDTTWESDQNTRKHRTQKS